MGGPKLWAEGVPIRWAGGGPKLWAEGVPIRWAVGGPKLWAGVPIRWAVGGPKLWAEGVPIRWDTELMADDSVPMLDSPSVNASLCDVIASLASDVA